MPNTTFDLLNIFLSILATITAYAICKSIYRKVTVDYLLPILTTPILLITLIVTSGVSHQRYAFGASFLTSMLKPATVAFAIPLYRHRTLLARWWRELSLSVLGGMVVSTGLTVLTARLIHLESVVLVSMAPRSVTTPVAMEIARLTGGLPALTAVFVILTGVVGAVAGPWIARRLGVKNYQSIAIALGSASHGCGTAKALEYGRDSGALASLAMILSAIAGSIIVPLFLNLFV